MSIYYHTYWINFCTNSVYILIFFYILMKLNFSSYSPRISDQLNQLVIIDTRCTFDLILFELKKHMNSEN